MLGSGSEWFGLYLGRGAGVIGDGLKYYGRDGAWARECI